MSAPSQYMVTCTNGTRSKPAAASSSSIPTAYWPKPSTTWESLCTRDPIELLQGNPHQRVRWLTARCNLDATAIWQWGVVERVATGLLLTKMSFSLSAARC